LVARAIRCADEANIFSEIVLSTDIHDAPWGEATIIHQRPEHLATDASSIEDTIADILKMVPGFDMLALLQPTSPTRTPEIVRECVMSVTSWIDAAVTVSEVPVKYHAQMQLMPDHFGYLMQAHPDGETVTNRQTLGRTYIRNGLCYAVTTDAFKQHGLFGWRCRPVFTAGQHVNIDTPEDLEEARRLLG
jgi:CMP-N,N'-diacetyllegionaminic acid synthase